MRLTPARTKTPAGNCVERGGVAEAGEEWERVYQVRGGRGWSR